MAGIRITISPGELLDRVTILEVRAACAALEAREAARKELDKLRRAMDRGGWVVELSDRCPAAWNDLRAVNIAIWEAEDVIRLCMRAGEFGAMFVKATREAHEKNDERARLKAEVNRLLGAPAEEKSYGVSDGPASAGSLGGSA